jgi:hypothetical protein
MALHPLHRDRQIKAIKRTLATAPKIQKDLRKYISKITEPYDKVGLDDSIFEFAELVGYRINNSLPKIAEDLDLEERYGLINNQPRTSVGRAFRGYDGEHFPDHEFEGLFGKGVHGTKINDIIEGIRYEDGGRKGYSKGLVNLTPEERIENARKGALITVENKTGVHGLTPEEMSENGRKGGLTRRGRGKWQTPERFKELCEFREESIGKGRKKTYPSWDYVADEFNRRHGTKYLAHQVERAYNRNKDLLSDEEE